MKNFAEFSKHLAERVAGRISNRPSFPYPTDSAPRPLEIEALEPRVLFSGSPAPAPAPEAAPEPAPAQAAPAPEIAPAPAAEAAQEVPTTNDAPTPVAAPPPEVIAAEVADSNVAAPAEANVALTEHSLATMAEAAAQRWIDSGISAEQTAALESITYQIADLGIGRLGVAEGSTIIIDDDAAASGSWFIDSSPDQDEEFSADPDTGALSAVLGSGAEGKHDLLSLLIHEQGHVLGLDHDSGGVMDEWFARGTRALPLEGQAEGAVPASLESSHHAIATNGTPASDGSPTTDTLSSFTVDAGTDRLLVVFVLEQSSDSITDVTFNGSILTKAGESATGFEHTEVWYAKLGTGGAITGDIVMVDNDSDGDGFGSVVAAVAYDGVDQGATPIDGFVANNAGLSNTVTSEANGDLVVGAAFRDGGANLVAGAGQSAIHTELDINDANGGLPQFITSQEAGAASVTMDYSGAGGSFAHSVAFNINTAVPLAAGPEIVVEHVASTMEIGDGDTTPSRIDEEGTNFGSVTTSTGTETRTFRIRNTGTSDLTLTGVTPVTFTGADASHFSVTGGQPTGVIASGSFVDFTVQYAPTADGLHDAVTLRIASDDADEADFDFALRGIGRNATASEVTQLGSTASVAGDGADTLSSFTVDAGNNRILVVFAYEREAETTTELDTVTFQGNTLTHAGSIKRGAGEGTFPNQMQLEAWYVTLGSGAAETGDIVISDTAGGAGLPSFIGAVAYENVDQSTPVDGFMAEYGLDDFSELLVTSEPGDLVVSAHMNVGNTAPDEPTVGSGQTALHDEDNINANNFLTSSEQGSAVVDSIFDWANDQFFVSLGMNLNAVLEPEILVQHDLNSVEIPDGDTTPTGIGDEGTDFGPVDTASGSEVRTFRITNDGNALLTLASVPVITGDPGGHFTPAAFSGDLTLDPGETRTFTVTFDPTAVGVHTAMVEFGSDDADESPYNFEITGEGTAAGPPATEETGVSVSGGDLIITDVLGGDTDDDFTISTTATTLTIIDNNGNGIDLGAVTGTGDGTDTVTIDLGASGWTGGIIWDALGGDDILRVDFGGGGNFSRAITFNGGANGGLGDELFLFGGGTFATAEFNYTNANDGTIDIAGQGTITYTGLEPIDMTGTTVTDFVFNLPAGTHNAKFSDLGSGNIRLESTDVGPTFESTDFAAPSGTITINGDAGSGSTVEVGSGVTLTANANHNVALNLTGGTLDVTANAQFDSLEGGSGDVVINGNSLTIDDGDGKTYAGTITGSAGTVALSSGIWTVAGANGPTLTGGTWTVDSGAELIVGADLTTSALGLADVTLNGGELTLDASVLTLPDLGGVTSNLALWLDGSDIDGDGLADTLLNGDTVSTWVDKSGAPAGQRDLTDIEGGNGPSYIASSTAGGAPAVGFDGVNDFLRSTYDFDALGANYSIISVARYSGPNTNGNQAERLISSDEHNWLFGFWGQAVDVWHPSGWVTGRNSLGAGYDTDWKVHAGVIGPDINGIVGQYAGNPAADMWSNGVQITDNNLGSNNGNYKPGRLSLGAWRNGGEENTVGEVAEVIIYDSALSTADRLAVEAYLAKKYSVSTGIATTLTNDITVIGNSTITLGTDVGAATLGALTMASGATLDVNGDAVADKSLGFASTELQGGTATVDTTMEPNVNLGTISETAASNLVISGNATVIMDSGSSHSGATTIGSGVTAKVSNANALGTSAGATMVEGGATLEINRGLAVGEAITLEGNSLLLKSSSGNGNLVLQGAITVTGDNAKIHSQGGNEMFIDGSLEIQAGNTLQIEVDNRINVRGPGMAGSGNIAVVQGGNDVLDLEVSSNSFAGNISIDQGRIEGHQDNALGTGTVTVLDGDATVLFRNSKTYSNDFIINGDGRGTEGAIWNHTGNNIIDGTVTMTGNSTVRVQPGLSLTVTGNVTGAFDLTKFDTGTLNLDGGGDSYGSATVSGGTLNIANDGASTAYNLADGTTLGLDGTFNLDASKISAAGDFTLSNLSGDTTLNGDLRAQELKAGTVTLESLAGTLTIQGDIDLGFMALDVDGAGDVVINGNISGTGTSTVLSQHDYFVGNATYGITGLDPLGYWNFNEGSGSTATDGSGNGNDGTFGGAATHTTGVTAGAGDFALDVNNGGFVDIVGNSGAADTGQFDLIQTNDEVTLMFWSNLRVDQNPRNNTTFQALEGGTRVAFTHAPYGNRNVYWDAGQGQRINTDIAGTGNQGLTTQLPNEWEDEWHWWVLTKDSDGSSGQRQAIYRDGELFHTGNGTQTFGSINNMRIAPDHRGLLDDVAIFGTSVDAATVEAMYAAHTGDEVADNQLTKTGSGTLTLAGTNSYIGETTLWEGTTIITSDDALGTADAGTTVGSEATLQFQGAFDETDESLTVEGGVTLQNLGGDTTISGTTAIVGEGAGEITILSDANTFTIDSDIELDFASLNLDGAGDIVINGAISGNATTGAVPELGGVTGGLQVWYDASDLDADGIVDTVDPDVFGGAISDGFQVTQWNDKSGNDRDATSSTPGQIPTWETNEVNGLSSVFFRQGNNDSGANDDELNFVDSENPFSGQERYFVFRSPSTTWSDYGGIFGKQDGNRGSNFIFERGDTNFHGNQLPANVSRDGVDFGNNPSLAPITDYMVLRVEVNGNDAGAHAQWVLGDDGTGWSMDMDLAEVIVYEAPLALNDRHKVQDYLADKYGIAGSFVPVSYSNDVDVTGTGTVTLTGNNTYEGVTTVTSGTLVAASDTALGTTDAGTVVEDGATLALDNTNLGHDGGATSGVVDIPAGETLTITGDGAGGMGAISNIAGDNVIHADIVQPEHAVSGAITYVPITGDADSGISSSKTYTHAIDFGNQPGSFPLANINGVAFANGSAGSLPGTGGGASHTVGTGSTSLPANHNGGSADASRVPIQGEDINDLLGDMIYNDATGLITLTGLTPEQPYQLKLYNRNWDVSTNPDQRDQTILFDTDGIAGAEATGTFNEDNSSHFDPAFTTANQVNALTYEYALAPGVTTLTININKIGGGGTYHLYGLTNEEVVIPDSVATITSKAGTLTIEGNATFEELTFDGAGDTTVDGNLLEGTGGGSSLIKDGTGTLTLSGANTYSDGTTVADGTLLANNASGSATGTGDATVENGAKLGGSGSVAGNVTVDSGGSLAPGSVATAVLNGGSDVTFNAGSSFEVDLEGTTPLSGHDQLAAAGTVTLGDSTLDATVGGSYVPAAGDSLTIITAGSIAGEFDGLADGDTLFLDGNPFSIDYQATAVVLDFDSNPAIHADDLGTGIDNNIEVRRNGANVEVEIDGTIVLDTLATNLTSLDLFGGDGDDIFTLDYSLGAGSLPTVNVFGEGNTTPTPGDQLVITGGAFNFDSATFNYDNLNDGSILLDDGTDTTTITYTGLEPISSSINATDVTLNYSSATETITITDAGSGQTTVNSTAGEITTFNNPTNSLTINSGGGDDTINLNGLAASYAADVTINGGAGADSLNVGGAITLAGDLHVAAETVTQSAALTVAGTASFQGADYEADVIADNPEIYYRFEETSGTSAAPTVGSVNGVYNGGIALADTGAITSAASNNAPHLDGSNDFIGISQGGGVLPASVFSDGTYSVELWMNQDSLADPKDLVGITNVSPNGHGVLLETVSGGELRYLHRSPSGNSGGTNINPSDSSYTAGAWNHIVAVDDGGDLKLYIDGVLDTKGESGAYNAINYAVNIAVGRLGIVNSGREFNGLLDEFAVYDQALTAAEVQAHFAAATAQTDVTLTNAGNNFGTVQVTNGGTVSFRDTNAMTLGTSSVEGSLTLHSNSTITQSGVLSGAGSLTKLGNGTMTLDQANTYEGTTSVTAGSLVVQNDAALGTTAGGTTVSTGASLKLQGGITVTGEALSIAGDSGTFALENLSGSNAWTGAIAADTSDILRFVSTSGTLTLGGDVVTSGTNQLVLQGNGNGVIDGIISGDGRLTKSITGTGTWTLSGANTYSGLTTISAGVIRATNDQALGSTAAGTTVASGAQLELSGGITVTGESLTISGSGTGNNGVLQSVSGNNTWAGNILLGANATRIGAAAGQTLTVSGVIDDGSSTYALAVRNASPTGTTVLSGANTYGGSTDVVVGLLKLDGGDDRLPVGTTLNMGNGSNVNSATFDLNGRSQQVAGLVGLGTTMPLTVTNGGAAATLTVNNSSNNTYRGAITGALSLAKSAAGTLTLSGTNSYTGTTNISGGTLSLNGAHTGGDTYTIQSGGTLSGNGGSTNAKILGDAGSSIVTAGNLTLGNTGSDSFETAGSITVNAGHILTANDSGLAQLGSSTVVNGTLTKGGSASGFSLGSGETISGSGTVNGKVTTNSGTISPGTGGPGQLTISDVDFGSSGAGKFDAQINGTAAGTGYDQLVVLAGGTVDLDAGNDTNLNLTLGFTPAVGATFKIIDNQGASAVVGEFAGLPDGDLIALTFSGTSNIFEIDYQGGDGNDVVLTALGGGYIWDGGGTNNNWSTAANWVNDTAPNDADPWDIIAFGGTTRLSPFANIAGSEGYNINDLVFLSDAGAFTLEGSKSLDMLGANNAAAADGTSDVINYSTATQTININLNHRSDFNTGLVFNALAGDIVVSGGIINRAGSSDPVTVLGNNTVTFSGSNNYQDQTIVGDGVSLSTLLANGTHAGAGNYTVNAGSTLGGDGSIDLASGKIVTVNGELAPGALGIGTLTVDGDVTLSGSFTAEFDGANHDLLAITNGGVTPGGTFDPTVTGTDPTGLLLTVIDNDGTDPITTEFSNYAEGDDVILGTKIYRIFYNGGDGNDVVLADTGNRTLGLSEYTTAAQNDTVGDDSPAEAGQFAGPLYVRERANQADPQFEVEAFLQFDLTGVSGTVSNANLFLHENNKLNNVNSAALFVAQVTDDWDAIGNDPAHSEAAGATGVSGEFSFGNNGPAGAGPVVDIDHNVDVTPFAQDWIDNPGDNNGVRLRIGQNNVGAAFDDSGVDAPLLTLTIPPAILYVNDGWSTLNDGVLVDGDLEAAGIQEAVTSISAFGSISDALATYANYGGTIIVNGGTYTTADFGGGGDVTVQLVQDLVDGQDHVTVNTLTGSAGDTITTAFHGNAGDLIVDSATNGTYDGTITGVGGLSKDGVGFLFLGGANTFTGQTSIDGGLVQLTNVNALQNTSLITVADGTTLDLAASGTFAARPIEIEGSGAGNRGAIRVGNGANWAGDITLTGDATINANGSANGTISATIGETGGSQNLTLNAAQVSSGTLNITGTSSNTYTGTTTTGGNGGTVALNKTAGLDAVSDDVNVVGGTLRWDADDQIPDATVLTQSGGTVLFNGHDETFADFNRSGGSTGTGSTNTVTITGTLSVTGGSNFDINSGTPGGTVSATTVFYSGGAMAIGQGGGTLEVGTGGLTMEATTLRMDGNNARLILDGNVITQASGSTATIRDNGTFQANRGLDLNGTTRTFTVADGGAAVDLDIQVPIFDSVGSAGITKEGTGTLQISTSGSGNEVNSYTGTTLIDAGTVALIGNAAIDTSAEIAVATGAFFDVTGRTGGGYTFGNSITGGGTTEGNLSLTSTADLRVGDSSGDDIGTFTINGDFAGTTGAVLEFELEGSTAAGTDYDQLAVNGAVALSDSTLQLTPLPTGYDPAVGETYTIIANDGADVVGGIFVGLVDDTYVSVPSTGAEPDQLFQISYDGPAGVGGDNDVVLTATALDVTTNIAIDTSGNLIVTDILGGNTDDNLTIYRNGSGNYIIEDPNNVLGTLIVGATQWNPGQVEIPSALVTGDVIVTTLEGTDTITIGDMGTLPGSLSVDGGLGEDSITQVAGATATLTGGSTATYTAETILMESGSSLTTGTGTVTLTAAGATGNVVGVTLKDASITSAGGNVDIDGEGGTTGTYARGVLLDIGSSIDAGGGSVDITGTGGGSALFGTGVLVNSADVSGAGVTISGDGGGGTMFNEGVSIQKGSEIDSGDGLLKIDGEGGANGSMNRGVSIGASTLTTSGGDIEVSGTGGGSTSGLYGIGVDFVGVTATAGGTGTITLTGTSNDGSTGSIGVKLAGASSLTAAADVTITGTSEATGGLLNHGVQIAAGSTIEVTGDADVSVTGESGEGTTLNHGIEFSGGSSVSTVDGDITLRGISNGTVSLNKGVSLAASTLETTGDGDILVEGNGSAAGTGTTNAGVDISGATLETNSAAIGTANITIKGTAGDGSTGNVGVKLAASSKVTTLGGNLAIEGTGGDGSSSNDGVTITALSEVKVDTGALTIKGTGGGTTSGTILNNGVHISGAGKVTSTGTGAITIEGEAGGGTTLNQGVRIISGNVSGAGAVNILGRASTIPTVTTTGILNTGVYMLSSTLNAGSGSTSLIQGTGGGGTMLNHGIYMQGIGGGFTGSTTGTVTDGNDLLDPPKSKPTDGNFFALLPLLMAEADRRTRRKDDEGEKQARWRRGEMANPFQMIVDESLALSPLDTTPLAPGDTLIFRDHGHAPQVIDSTTLESLLGSLPFPETPGQPTIIIVSGSDALPIAYQTMIASDGTLSSEYTRLEIQDPEALTQIYDSAQSVDGGSRLFAQEEGTEHWASDCQTSNRYMDIQSRLFAQLAEG